MDQYLLVSIFSGMNIHLPAILMFTRGTRVLTHCHISIMFWDIKTADFGPLIAEFLTFHDPSRFGDFLSSVHCISCKTLRFLLSSFELILPCLSFFPASLSSAISSLRTDCEGTLATSGIRGNISRTETISSSTLKTSWIQMMEGPPGAAQPVQHGLSSENWRIPATLKSLTWSTSSVRQTTL